MREGGFHGPNPEDEFIASVEEDDDKESKKSKRKKRFDKLINFLIPKKSKEDSPEAEESEEPSRIENFFEASKSMFGKILGIEREDLDEEDNEAIEEAYEEDEPDQRSFRIGGLFSAPELSETPDVQDETLHEAEEQVAYDVEPEQLAGQPEEEQPLESQSEIPEPQLEVEPLAPEESELPYIQEMARTNAEDYEPINRAEPQETIDRNTGSESKETTIIERRGGAGAALVGFVAAETLSRSRDKKIRKKAEELSKEVDKNKKEQEDKNIELEALQRRQRKELESLQRKRTGEVKDTKPSVEKKPERQEHSTRQSRTQEIMHPKTESTQEKGPEVYETAPKLKPQQERTQYSPEVHSATDERLHLEQVESAAENDIPIEAYYERSHEAKDVASSSSTRVTNFSGSDVSQGHQLTNNLPDYNNAQLDATHQKTSNNDLYKTAVKQGATAGIVVVIAVAIILLIWSLL